MEFKDYYKILGVSATADAAEIKTSYRKLARKYHPDISKEKDAEEKFKELGEAYEVLKDPEKRAEYDQLRQLGAQQPDGRFRPPPDWKSAADFSEGGYTNADAGQFSDFFESIFGNAGTAHRSYSREGAQRSFRMRGQDIHYKIALFLEEAQRGGQRQITLRVPETDEYGLVTHREKNLNIKIPAGVTQGQHIRLAGQGAQGIGGAEAGDLFLEIEFAPHPYFSVDGKNIILTLPVTAPEAALGATLEVPTLSGKIKLKVPKGSSSGDKLRIKGKGLSGDPPGDQLVVLQVNLPKQHSELTESLYRQIAEQESAFNPRATLGE
ncbi:MAG TPA: DnaJ C-terminal domain-containing protein [Spongiibacteraceae bacterium]